MADATAPRVARAFHDIDESPMQPWLVAYLERVGRRADMRRLDAALLRLLDLRPGERVLEIGAGLGDDAVELAGIVGEQGLVVAVDRSRAMATATAARAQAAGVRIDVRLGDMATLPAEDSSCDAVRAERTLQYAADVERVLADVVRVLRPGGRVALAEPDWGSMTADIGDDELVESMLSPFVAMMRSAGGDPRVGLHLPRLLRAAGFVDVRVEVVSIVEDDVDSAGEVLPMFARQLPPDIAEWTATLPGFDRWRAALDSAAATGDFLATLQMWVVGARKP